MQFLNRCLRCIWISRRARCWRIWRRWSGRGGGRVLWGNGKDVISCPRWRFEGVEVGVKVAVGIRLTCMRNRGELSDGWYDPSTLQKALQSESAAAPDTDRASMRERPRSPAASTAVPFRGTDQEAVEVDSDSDDSIGPALPGQETQSRRSRPGPRIPNMQDLELKRGAYYPAWRILYYGLIIYFV